MSNNNEEKESQDKHKKNNNLEKKKLDKKRDQNTKQTNNEPRVVKPEMPKVSFEELYQNRVENDIEQTLKLLGIDPNEKEIDFLDLDESSGIYYRNDAKYTEVKDYIEGELLGKGMFGEVKEFVNKKSCQRFAAKIMNKNWIERRGPNVMRNVNHEINFVHKLNHKNVMRMLDTFIYKNNIYLILEFCSAVLEEFLSANPSKKLPKSQSHYYFCQLMDGLEYLHNRGIIHRDIKPANLLVTSCDTIKIGDFGISIQLNSFSDNDLIQSSDGSPYFQPPEIHDDLSDDICGTKVDIWSSGCILFNLITGILPFDNKNGTFFEDVINKDVEYPQEISNDLQLVDLLNQIFIKKFKQRITISEIKRHAWIVKKLSYNDFISLPPKSTGDLYRSLSVLPSLQNKFNPLTDQNLEINKQEYEESLRRSPNIRTNRLKTSKSQSKRKVTPTQKLIRLGLSIKINP